MKNKIRKISKNHMKNNLIKNLLVIVLLFVFMASLFTFLQAPKEKPKEISMNELVQQIEEGKIQEIIVKENKVEITLNDEKNTKEITLKDGDSSLVEQLITVYDLDQEKIAKINITTKGKTGIKGFLGNFGPTILMFVLLGFLLWTMLRQVYFRY